MNWYWLKELFWPDLPCLETDLRARVVRGEPFMTYAPMPSPAMQAYRDNHCLTGMDVRNLVDEVNALRRRVAELEKPNCKAYEEKS